MTSLDTDRLDMLRDLGPDGAAYVDRAIGNFQVSSVAAVEAVRRCIAAGDAAGMRAAAHKISGSALNLGAFFASAAAREIEALGTAGTTHGAAELVPALEEAMARARALLLSYQAERAASD